MIAQANDTNAIHETLTEAHAGRLIFPDVVRRMLAVGVASYFVDLVRAQDVVYLADDSTLTEPLHLDYIPQHGRALELNTVLSLNYGFGGHIGALLFQNT